MTVFQLNRSSASSAATKTWAQPTHVTNRHGRHAVELRAKLSLRRMFYVARHSGR